MMNKAKLNYLVDFGMLIFFVIVAITGLILFFFLPSGVRQGGHQLFAGITKSSRIVIHDRSGILLIIAVALHFILHWNRIVQMTKKVFKNT